MGENIRKRLDEAAIEGDVTTLLELLKQDPILLARLNLNHFNETPLHVASLLGHVTFVDEILKRRPQLAKEFDSRRCSPLHLSAAEGFLDIVKILVRVDPDMCSICNEDGLNPIHLAAMRGRVDVLAELVRVRPAAARTAVDGGGTVLHLCVKYNQVEALKMLIESMEVRDNGFINTKDDYGFNILHLAVTLKQLQTVKYLINHSGIEVNAKTSNGFTALDILTQSHRDLKDLDIAETLRAANAVRTTNKNPSSSSSSSSWSSFFRKGDRWFLNGKRDWIKKQDTLMVVASLIATMAFQAGVNPPGGVWQDDKTTSGSSTTQVAGTSIFATKYKDKYDKYVVFNTIGFTTSLISILLIITGLPEKGIFMRILIITMWIAVSSMAYTYGYSISYFTPQTGKESDSSSMAPQPGGPRKHSDVGVSSIGIFPIFIWITILATSSVGLFLIGKLIYLRFRNKNTHHHQLPSLDI